MFMILVNGISRVSLRSKGQIDVSRIAGVFDGGGHFNAAGCTVENVDVKEVKEIILKEIFGTYK